MGDKYSPNENLEISIESDDEAFQQAYLSSMSALEAANKHSGTSINLQNDLRGYLETMDNKVDSEGNKLISYPANFDKISEVMTRNDLVDDSTANSWSKTLLNMQFPTEFDNGRYKNILKNDENDDIIQKGIASIHLLDNQLRIASKKAHEINRQLSISSEPSLIFGNNHFHVDKSTPRSVQESIFITRPKSTKDSLTDAPTPRNEIVSEGIKYENEDNAQDEIDNVSVDSTNSPKAEEPIDSKPLSSTKKKPRALNDEEEFRIQAILHDDYEKIYSYDSIIQTAKLAEIDSKLEDFGRLSRFDVRSLEEDIFKQYKIPVESSAKSQKSNVDYLLEQRKERVKKEYSQKIDDFLNDIKKQEVNYRDLVNSDSSRSIKSSSSCKRRLSSDINSQSRLLQVPSYQDLIDRPRKEITREDISQLVQECLEEANRLLPSEMTNGDTSLSFDTNQQSHSNSTTKKISTIFLKDSDQRKFDLLLNSIQRDCHALAELRKQNSPNDLEAALSEADSLLSHVASNRLIAEELTIMFDQDTTRLLDNNKTESDEKVKNGDFPSSDVFEQREIEILQKLVTKSEQLRLPPVPGAEYNHEHAVMAAASSKSYVPLDKSLHRLLKR